MILIGIDPGKTGAIAVNIEGQLTELHQMPLVGKEYDIPGFLSLLRTFDKSETHVVYEVLHAMPGSKGGSKANFGRGYALAMIETAVTALRLPCTPVRPQAWQKVMFAGQKVAKGQSKAAALIAARRLWPEQKFLIGKRNKPDEGYVDAALIAEWGRREIA